MSTVLSHPNPMPREWEARVREIVREVIRDETRHDRNLYSAVKRAVDALHVALKDGHGGHV